MARYTGPKAKLCRRYSTNLFGNPKYDKILERRNFPPGQHGQSFRKKPSDYGIHLMEKQKVRLMYCLLERQFRNYFAKAARMRGITGDNLFQLLEMRLDNTVYRMGLAVNRMQSRQIVRHGHILVNGKKVDIPSYNCRPGEVITVAPKSRDKAFIRENVERLEGSCIYEWLSFNPQDMSGSVLAVPSRQQIPVDIDDRLIVEFYSK